MEGERIGEQSHPGVGGRPRGGHGRRRRKQASIDGPVGAPCYSSSGRCVHVQVFTPAWRERSAQSRQRLPCRPSGGPPWHCAGAVEIRMKRRPRLAPVGPASSSGTVGVRSGQRV